MKRSSVVDTMVLRKANAPITKESKPNRDFPRRVALLKSIRDGERAVLISKKMLTEYQEQVREPRNDFVKAFFDILTSGAGCTFNWPAWPGRLEEQRNKCRFPKEDTHVLRTAYRNGERTELFSEEKRILVATDCVLRTFDVHIQNPVATKV